MRTDLPCMLGRLHSFRGSREYRVQGFLLFYDRILYMAALVYTWLSPLKKKRPRIGAFSRKNCTKERIRLENDLLMEAAELHGQKLLLPRCAPQGARIIERRFFTHETHKTLAHGLGSTHRLYLTVHDGGVLPRSHSTFQESSYMQVYCNTPLI